jgi:hypothetical protein
MTSPIFRQNGTATAKLTYTVVNTYCYSPAFFNSTDLPYVEVDGSYKGSLSTIDDLVGNASGSTVTDGYRRHHSPIWLPSPNPESASLIGVFVSQRLKSPGDISITACTLAASWEDGEMQLQQSETQEMVKTVSYDRKTAHGTRGIRLNVANVQNDAAFHLQMMQTILRRNEEPSVYRYPLTLATIFALAISRIPMPVMWIGEDERYTVVGLERDAPSAQDATNMTALHYTLIEYGFGYGGRSTSVYLAMTVILTYSIITISYMVYTVTTGTSSTAWNHGIELVTLALQSRKPDHLGHASVGIDSINTFSEPVGIRVNTQNELELVFAHGRDFGTRDLRKVEHNKEY